MVKKIDFYCIMPRDNIIAGNNSNPDTEGIFSDIIRFINENKYNEEIQIRSDIGNKILKIYSQNSSILSRANAAISEVLDLSYSSAEHHPYWMLLYNASEIVKSVLEVWNSELSKDQISECYWRLEEIRSSLDRISEY
jgi:hypothetical protein